MAIKKAKRSISKKQSVHSIQPTAGRGLRRSVKPENQNRLAQRRRLSPRRKYLAYDVLHDLNRGFQLTHSGLERLRRLDLMPREQLRPCEHMADEVWSLTNSALLGVLHDAEFHDAAYFEKLRLKSN